MGFPWGDCCSLNRTFDWHCHLLLLEYNDSGFLWQNINKHKIIPIQHIRIWRCFPDLVNQFLSEAFPNITICFLSSSTASFHLLSRLRELSSFTLVPAILLPELFLSLILSHLRLVRSSSSFREEAISFSSSQDSTQTSGTRLNESWKGVDFYHSRAKGKVKAAYATLYNREKSAMKYLLTFAEDTCEKPRPFSGENYL